MHYTLESEATHKIGVFPGSTVIFLKLYIATFSEIEIVSPKQGFFSFSIEKEMFKLVIVLR